MIKSLNCYQQDIPGLKQIIGVQYSQKKKSIFVYNVKITQKKSKCYFFRGNTITSSEIGSKSVDLCIVNYTISPKTNFFVGQKQDHCRYHVFLACSCLLLTALIDVLGLNVR